MMLFCYGKASFDYEKEIQNHTATTGRYIHFLFSSYHRRYDYQSGSSRDEDKSKHGATKRRYQLSQALTCDYSHD